MASPKRRIGNYSQNVTDDAEGILKSVTTTRPPRNMNKVERDYYKGTGGRASAGEAIERARRANANNKTINKKKGR